MTTEKVEFDTSAMHALNANIMKCLDGMNAASLLSKSLTPEEKRHLARATEDFTNGLYNAAVIRYEAYVTSKRKLPLNNNEHSRLDIIVQYLVCKCLLQSNQFLELNKARSILTDLEVSFGGTYPMIYLGLTQFYTKVFCFDEAERMATKGLSVANSSDFPVCYLPESETLIPESTMDELTKQLTSLKEQCSGWHPPDARCFMTICRLTSQNHICGRDIFVKSPAYNGMVTVTCSNTTNPCEIHFHCACWKVKKDESSSIAKISDKEVLLNWECFTPNCGTEEEPSLIKKITIHKEDGSVKDIEPSADKSQWHAQQTTSISKGATRKQKQLSRITSKVPRVKHILPVDKISETTEHPHTSEDALNVCGVVQGVEEVVESLETTTCDLFTSKVMQMISLRELNFNIDPDNDWRPNKAYYGNEHMRSTIDTSYEPDFSEDGESKIFIKSFLFSYFLSYIENRGPIKNDDLMREWNSLTESSDFEPILKDFDGIIDVRKFLLQSLKFVAIGNYICIPALLPGAYALAEEEAELRVMEMMEKKTFDFSSGHLKRRKKTEVEVKSEPRDRAATASAKVEGEKAEADPAESDPFLLTAEDFLDDVEEESDGDAYSTTVESEDSSDTNASFQTPVKKMKVQEVEEDVAGDVKKKLEKKFVEEEMKETAVKEKGEDEGADGGRVEENNGDEIEGIERMEESDKEEVIEQPSCKVEQAAREQMPPPPKPHEVKQRKKKKHEIKQGKKQVITTQKKKNKNKKNQQSNNRKPSEKPKEISERCVIETESEGTLDDQDDLPWDCKKHEYCRCEKLYDQEAAIKTLEEELESYREELRRSGERLKMSEDEHLKTQEKLQKTQDELQEAQGKLQTVSDKLQKNKDELETVKTRLKETEDQLKTTETDLQSSRNELKSEQDKSTEMKRKMSMKILDYEFNYNVNLITCKIDITQSQYAVVAKLQNLVHQITKNYLNVDWTEWADPLEKLERMRADLESEHRKLTKLMKSNNPSEEREQAFRTHMNTLNSPPLPQRNIQDLMEIAVNMLKNHFQQPMPRYAPPPSLPCSPYHPLNNPMMPSGSFQSSGYSRPPYVRAGFQREYSPYLGSPITITDVTTNPPSATPPVQTSDDKKKKAEVRRESSESESSEEHSEKRSGESSRSEVSSSSRDAVDPGQGPVAAVEGQPNEPQVDKNSQDIVSSQVHASPAVASDNTNVRVKNYIQVPPPVPTVPPTKVKPAQVILKAPVQAHVQTSAQTLQDPSVIMSVLAQSVQPIEASDAKPPVPGSSMMPALASTSSSSPPLTVNAAPTTPVEAAKALPATTVKPATLAANFASLVALAASSSYAVNKMPRPAEVVSAQNLQIHPSSPIPQAMKVPQNVPATPPAKKLLTALDVTAQQAVKASAKTASSDSSSSAVHQGLVKEKMSEQSAPPSRPPSVQEPERNNERPVHGFGEVKKQKIQSMDKLLHILRNKHPGVLEFDLIWSIKIVRKNHNDSLTGLPLVQIIAEADKILNSRQKLQLIPYLSSNKPANVKNQGVYLTTQAGRTGSDPNSSTSSVSSFHRDTVAKKNPWSKPQNVSWIKESPEAECVICWETLVSELKIPTYTLECQHTFHKQCLVTWFNQSRSCPTCRIHSTIDDEFPPLP
ncbi:uncharacterized protein LOC107042959 isoform X3 [Diachasma alloeum]|uniref:uncharacterized protein LOC107042959 isoform X3 n=1 Tax=Diachasma alloeum TaxID=454923 RepID=UPI000738292D|nr:uncharacterized protein LOC107042959 isoform X3 [Diachasma alloeum]